MRECSSCGHPNAEDAEFCASPDCREYLGWSTAVVEVPTQPDVAAPREPRSVGPARPVSAVRQQRAGVRVSLNPESLEVEPGGVITTQLTVHNNGTQVEQFRIAVSGSAAPCAVVESPAITVYPDAEQPVTIRFAPQRSSRTPAGRLPFVASAQSMLHRDLHDDASGTLTIGAFTDLQARLRPEASRGRRPARHHVVAMNNGNVPLGVRIGWSDRDGALTYDPPQSTATLPPGGTVESPAMIGGARKWFGRIQTHSFTATVAPAGDSSPVGLNGVRHQVPVFPWWIPTAAVVLLALAMGIVALWPKDKVPATRGLTEAAAITALEDAGYRAEPIPRPDEVVPAGQVIDTAPGEGAELAPGEQVQVIVSSGKCEGACPVEVPNVEGLTLARAQEVLEKVGFRVPRQIEAPSAEVPNGSVIESQPAAGELKELGSEVVLTVSTGAPTTAPSTTPPVPTPTDAIPVPLPIPNDPGGPGGSGGSGESEATVPDVAGMTREEALVALAKAGYKPVIEQVESADVPVGSAIDTDPPAETKLAADEPVALRISTGPALPVVHAEGESVSLAEGKTIDLDESGPSSPADASGTNVPADENSPSADLSFDATSPPRTLAPVGKATLAEGTDEGYPACANAEFGTEPIDVETLKTDSVLCIQTDEKRISVVRVEAAPGPSPGTLTMSYTTYDPAPA